jgi:hypothetical protein
VILTEPKVYRPSKETTFSVGIEFEIRKKGRERMKNV